MIQTLQKKFVFTAMVAITALLCLLLGAINIGNAVISNKETEKTLQMLSDYEGDPKNLLPMQAESAIGAPDAAPRVPVESAPRGDYDVFMSSNFFVVRFDEIGQLAAVDVSRTSKVSESEAVTLAVRACETGKESGKLEGYRYRVARYAGQRRTVVFLDTAAKRASNLRVLVLSAVLGLACWGAMLLLTILLSKRAIRPIAENIARQKQFVTNAGHELKTPLAIIQSNTEAMELYNGENKWSRNIKAQTQRLSALMQKLLLLARMDEAGTLSAPTELALDVMMQQALDGFRQPMEMRGIRITEEIEPNAIVHADRAQTAQLLTILLENALAYTAQDGSFYLRLQRTERGVSLTAENTCTQLPPVPPEKLFERFYRADEARTQQNGGCGIGLSAARAIAEANHAELRADYPQANTIRFTLRFPAHGC